MINILPTVKCNNAYLNNIIIYLLPTKIVSFNNYYRYRIIL